MLDDIPKAPKYERAVLGCMMFDIEAAEKAIGVLTGSCFYNPINEILFNVFCELYESHSAIDQLTVEAVLIEKNKLDTIGGAPFIAGISVETMSGASIGYFCGVLVEYDKRRKLYLLGKNTVAMSIDNSERSEDTTEKIQESLNSIDIKKEHDYKVLKEILPEAYQSIVDMRDKSKNIGVSSGISSIDKALGGFKNNELITLAGRTSQGKTALALDIAINVAKQNIPVLYFSMEMSCNDITKRLISKESPAEIAGIQYKSFKSGEEEKMFWTNISDGCRRLSEIPIIIDETPAISLMKLQVKIEKCIREYGVKIIIIDYLQLLEGAQGEGRRLEIESITRALKQFAMQYKIPIIALSQLSRSADHRGEEHRPILSDLRESGCLRGNTLILSRCHNKIKNIKSLDNDNNLTILDSHSKKEGSIMSNVKKCFTTGKKQFYKLKLITGHSIEATANHKFMSPCAEWTKMEDLQVGSLVGVPLNFIENENKNTLKDNEIKVLALFLGNGCAIPRRSLQYTSNKYDADICDELMSIANKITNNELRPYKKTDTYRKGTDKESSAIQVFFPAIKQVSRSYRNPLVLFFKKYGLYGKRHTTKEIPGEIFFQSKKKIKLFIKYLWATDGTISISHKGKKNVAIMYSSSSELLVFQLQLLLQSIGILSSIRKIIQGKYQWYNLTVNSRYFQSKFLKEIGVAGKRKNNMVKKALKRIKITIPGWTKYELSKDESVAYVPVKEITKTDIDIAYDIEVDNTHNFYANGIIVHNSIEQDSDIVMFIHNATKEQKRQYDLDSEENCENIRELIIRKNRNGECSTVLLYWKAEYASFYGLYKQVEMAGKD